MKKFLFISFILCYISVLSAIEDIEEKVKNICLAKLGKVDPDAVADPKKDPSPEELNNLMCCVFETKLKVFKVNLTLQEVFKNSVVEAKLPNTGPITETILLDKLNKCNNTAGPDTCKYFACIQFFEPPFSTFYNQQFQRMSKQRSNV